MTLFSNHLYFIVVFFTEKIVYTKKIYTFADAIEKIMAR